MKKRLLATAAVFAALSANAAFAGTLTLGTNTSTGAAGPTEVAKELIKGAATDFAVNVGTRIASYTPTDINLPGGLIDPQVHGTLIVLSLSDATAKFDSAVASSLIVCSDANEKVAGYVAGNGTSQLSFNGTAATTSIINTINYSIQKTACGTPLAAGDLTVKIPKADTNTGIGLTWKTYATVVNPTVPQDSASAAKIISVVDGVTATVTKLDAVIDSTNNFLDFVTGVTTDDLSVKLTVANIEHPVVPAIGDKVTVKVKPSSKTGLIKATGDAFITGASVVQTTAPGMPAATACTVVSATNVITCQNTATAVTYADTTGVTHVITFTVPGDTAITAKTFTASAELDFATATYADDTIANTSALLVDITDAGKWTVNGFTGILPYLYTGTTPDMTTYCLINNAGSQEATVFVTPNSTAGTPALSSVTSQEIGTIAATKSRLLIFATDNIYFNDAVTSTHQLAPLAGASAIRYSAEILVTGNPKDITINCLQNDPQGSKRILPVLVNAADAPAFQYHTN